MIIEYIGLFILNLLIELTVAIIMKYRTKHQILAVFAVNAITHPALTVIILLAYTYDYYSLGMVLLLEVLVVLSEWQLFQFIFREKHQKYLILAIALNVVSYGIGLIIQ